MMRVARKRPRLDTSSTENADVLTKIDINVREEHALNSGKRKRTAARSSNVVRRCKECQSVEENLETQPNILECDEDVALTFELLSSGRKDDEFEESEGTMLVKQAIVDTRFYCENGHLCSLDGGMMEKNKMIFMSGYLKPYSATDVSPEGGVKIYKSSAVHEWYFSGLGEETITMNVSTACGYYKILSVAEDYGPFFANLWNYTSFTNHFVRCLFQQDKDSFDDVISSFEPSPSGNMQHLLRELTNEDVIANSQFIYQKIHSFMAEENEDGIDDLHLLQLDMFTEFCNLSNVLETGKSAVKKTAKKLKIKKNAVIKLKPTKAVTTPVVSETFAHIFHEQMENKTGKDKTWLNLEATKKMVQQAYDLHFKAAPQGKLSYIFKDKGQDFVDCCTVKGKIGEFKLQPAVFVGISKHGLPKTLKDFKDGATVGQIQYMKVKKKKLVCHVQLFYKSYQSLLGYAADRQELFGSIYCTDVNVEDIICTLPIVHKSVATSTKTDLFYQFQHVKENGTFTTIPEFTADDCRACIITKEMENRYKVQLKKDNFTLNKQTYSRGSCIMIECRNADIYTVESESEDEPEKKVDKNVYTEAYRKEGSRSNTIQFKKEDAPFDICQIEEISVGKWKEEAWLEPAEVKLKVRMFLKPQATNVEGALTLCPHLLYYCEKLITISAEQIRGIAYVAYLGNILLDTSLWLTLGSTRFYFLKKYNSKTKQIEEVPASAKKLKGSIDIETGEHVNPPCHPELPEPLKSFDLFAGCGGMTSGLHKSGLCQTYWANEFEPSAAAAFKQNFPEAEVFVEDINLLLNNILKGFDQNSSGQKYPRKGEVDFISGGPPCQGFSSMNRFGAGECSAFKNSLVTPFFSMIDHFRPKFFIFENVKNFSTNCENVYWRTAIACCNRMGYQTRAGVLQAGAYGIPQSRHRTIIIGALPEYQLPNFPKITHSGLLMSQQLTVDGVLIDSGTSYSDPRVKGAPYRAITVLDAISDLPDIDVEETKPPKYLPAVSTYQETLRLGSSKLTEQVSRNLSPLDQERISLIPANGDWRDLPNIRKKLSDGTYCEPLNYIYEDDAKAVCPCVFKGKSATERKKVTCVKPTMKKTLIPWCLPHTGDRFNNWRGLYGRLKWLRQFSTTVTMPQPMGKQGRVLHPDYNRCFTVREAARSQGFADLMQFVGSVADKFRQVGNAVPPPLAELLGYQVIDAYQVK